MYFLLGTLFGSIITAAMALFIYKVKRASLLSELVISGLLVHPTGIYKVTQSTVFTDTDECSSP